MSIIAEGHFNLGDTVNICAQTYSAEGVPVPADGNVNYTVYADGDMNKVVAVGYMSPVGSGGAYRVPINLTSAYNVSRVYSVLVSAVVGTRLGYQWHTFYINDPATMPLTKQQTRDAMTLPYTAGLLLQDKSIDSEIGIANVTTQFINSNVNAVKVDTSTIIGKLGDGLSVDLTPIENKLTDIDTTTRAIRAKTDLLGTGYIDFGTPQVVDGAMLVYSGQDHIGPRALQWTVTNWPGPDLTGGTMGMRFMSRDRYNNKERWGEIDYPASFEYDATTGTVSVVVSMTAAETLAFSIGERAYRYQLISVNASNDVTVVVDGWMTVRTVTLNPGV